MLVPKGRKDEPGVLTPGTDRQRPALKGRKENRPEGVARKPFINTSP